MPSSHEGISTQVHTETRPLPGGREDRNQHPGYMWSICTVCGAEFEYGKGAEENYSMVIDTCGDVNCNGDIKVGL